MLAKTVADTITSAKRITEIFKGLSKIFNRKDSHRWFFFSPLKAHIFRISRWRLTLECMCLSFPAASPLETTTLNRLRSLHTSRDICLLFFFVALWLFLKASLKNTNVCCQSGPISDEVRRNTAWDRNQGHLHTQKNTEPAVSNIINVFIQN